MTTLVTSFILRFQCSLTQDAGPLGFDHLPQSVGVWLLIGAYGGAGPVGIRSRIYVVEETVLFDRELKYNLYNSVYMTHIDRHILFIFAK